MIYFVSDTHFSHPKIIQYSKRPFQNAEEMDRTLIENWNAVVQPTDIVWHLGDAFFCKIDRVKSILRQLNGHKNLVFGNHDKVLHENREALLSEGLFQKMVADYELKYEGAFVVLHHYGKRVWNKSHHGSFHLFGHSHGELPPHGKSVDVGVDAAWITGKAEYRPFSFEEVKRFLDKREVIRHHAERMDD